MTSEEIIAPATADNNHAAVEPPAVRGVLDGAPPELVGFNKAPVHKKTPHTGGYDCFRAWMCTL
jgi:hypothetical protein